MAGAAGTFGLSRIGQIAIPVKNLARAVSFYRDTLGMPLLFEAPPNLAFFDCGGVRLMLGLPEGPADAERMASVLYYAVDDIHAAASTLAERGVTFEASPHIVAKLPHADVWMAFFRDADRNMLALMSEVKPA
jgi:methylmalonyl-CoA/ethylmalonyl-CoA epimerase